MDSLGACVLRVYLQRVCQRTGPCLGLKANRRAAINVDTNAPIFDFANYALVGNALELLPALQAAFEKRLAAARARQGAAAQDEGAR